MATDAGYRLLAEHCTDVIVRASLDGELLYVSPACRRFGYEPAELIGQRTDALVHPDDLNRFAQRTIDLAKGGQVDRQVDREHRFRCKDGSWVWLEGNPELIRDAHGKALEVVNVFRDVTERRRLRDAAAEQERFAKLAKEVAGVGYWRLDTRSQAISWSDGMFRAFGLDVSSEPPLDRAMAMVHPDDQAATSGLLDRALRTGEGWTDNTSRIVRPDGQVRYVEGRAICETDQDGVRAVFGTLVDVTERRIAERRYRLIAEHATDMIVTTNLDGRATYATPSCFRIMGYQPDEVVGASTIDFAHPDDRADVVAAFRDVYEGRDGRNLRWRARHKTDDRWVWLESNPTFLRATEPGEEAVFLDVVRDVTAVVAQEEALARATVAAEAAAKAKSDFLANMSHEIRTPLTAILGFTNLLANREGLDEIAQGHIARVSSAGRTLLAIVNDILDFSTLEAGRVELAPRPISPAALAHDVLLMFSPQADAKGLSLHFSEGPGVPDFVSLDPDRLRQILLNLVGNAVKFTARGDIRLRIAYDRAGARLRCEVEDSGPGMTAEQQQRLFQRFSQVDGSSTRTFGGTGLGLAICQGLAEAMGGQISVVSAAGRGSTFTLVLPAQAARQDEDAVQSCEPAPVLDGVRVLVVDDNAVNRELVRALLEASGAELIEASDGAAGLDQAMSMPFDAILLDFRMPEISGPELLKLIRSEPGPNRGVPIFAFTADTDAAGLIGGHGFDAAISKPLDPMALIATIAGVALADISRDGLRHANQY